jgi:NAD(P)-dependent dehydrogenase (short-subunit alcohol dehydrogenase family)
MLEWLFGKSFDPEKDIASLEGKVILVTGGTCKLNDPACATLMSSTGNAGLGKETILQLAKHHPKEIFLAARTQEKAEDAIQEIKEAVPDSNISYIKLDLTSFASVKEAAEEFKRRSERLDILINNAGDCSCTRSQAQKLIQFT